jgi:hypothetical protein
MKVQIKAILFFCFLFIFSGTGILSFHTISNEGIVFNTQTGSTHSIITTSVGHSKRFHRFKMPCRGIEVSVVSIPSPNHHIVNYLFSGLEAELSAISPEAEYTSFVFIKIPYYPGYSGCYSLRGPPSLS